MYLYYQKLQGVTEFSLSSDGRTNSLNWKSKSEKTTAEFIIWNFKQVVNANRIMDDKTKIWSIIGTSGDILLAHFESFITQGALRCTLKEVTDNLQERSRIGRLDRPLAKASAEEIKFKEEDFFYAPQGAQSALSGEELYSRLAPLIGLDIPSLKSLSDESQLKRLYRQAALRLHPDRNNGDGSRMSELNMLWSIFNQGVSK